MSVLNGELYLREAVDSVLAQSFRDFEFLIVDNASTDRTPEIIGSYEDSRIVHIRNPETLNLSQSLNRGLQQARGAYVARLDADDIALPGRLERQAAFLDDNPRVALVASAFYRFGDCEPLPGVLANPPPADHDGLMAGLAEAGILAHSSIMFRRDPVVAFGGYDEAYAYCMDYVLYFELARTHRLASFTEPLVAMRMHGGQITLRPEWAARRNLELARALRTAADQPEQPAFVRQALRRHLTLTALRLAVLFLRTFRPFKAGAWLGRAIQAGGPGVFLETLRAAIGRRLARR